MASKLIGLAASGIGSALNQQNQVQPQIDPMLLKFLQDEGTLAARFQGSQEGLPYGGSTATTARAGFNQYGALLSANQTANQVAQANISAQQQALQAQNVGQQLQSQQGTAAGNQSVPDTTSSSTGGTAP